MIRTLCTVMMMFALIALAGCNGGSAPTNQADVREDAKDLADHDHADHDNHDHAHDDHAHADDEHANDDHGAAIDLGTTTIGSYTVRAARGEGELTAGSEGHIDVWVDGDLADVIAVRIWIGVENAAGSIKARGEVDDPEHLDHFHAHAEVPNPTPAGSKLWVELEITGEGKKTASFDLKSPQG